MKPYYDDGQALLLCGNCLEVLPQLEGESIQCVVTSPPYWGLRKYSGEQEFTWGDNHCEHEWGNIIIPKARSNWDTFEQYRNDGGAGKRAIGINATQGCFCSRCGAWRGAYGLEPTPEMYVDHTIEILRAIRRVLRPDGVVFWNIGDSYNGATSNQTGSHGYKDGRANRDKRFSVGSVIGLKPKDLCLIPFRVALAAQADGWWMRSVIIWSKPNPMPESVKDRPTESHEYILMLTKSARYYWDMEAVREPAQDWGTRDRTDGKYRKVGLANGLENDSNPDGRNIRTVWEFPTQPYPEAHFAVFPEALPEKCILAASKEGDTILDPFCGTGTTLWKAKKLGRRAIGIDVAEEYCQLSVERCRQLGMQFA